MTSAYGRRGLPDTVRDVKRGALEKANGGRTFSWPGSWLHLTFRALSRQRMGRRAFGPRKRIYEPAGIASCVLFSGRRECLRELVNLALHGGRGKVEGWNEVRSPRRDDNDYMPAGGTEGTETHSGTTSPTPPATPGGP